MFSDTCKHANCENNFDMFKGAREKCHASKKRRNSIHWPLVTGK